MTFFLRLGVGRPNGRVGPGPHPRTSTPCNSRTTRSDVTRPMAARDPGHPIKPQNQGTSKRSSITLPSTSLASDRGRPRSPRILARNTQKSGSTESPWGCRMTSRYRAKQGPGERHGEEGQAPPSPPHPSPPLGVGRPFSDPAFELPDFLCKQKGKLFL